MRPNRFIRTAFALALLLPAAGAQVDFRQVLITEVSWDEPEGVEITNFTGASADLSAWTVTWRDPTGTYTSAPLGVILAPGASVVVVEPAPVPPAEVPAGVPVVTALPTLNVTIEAVTVGIFEPAAALPRDEVRISNVGGSNTLAPLGAATAFRGLARRGLLVPSRCVERIWGLDSDAGADWVEEMQRGFGLESRHSGLRGTDSLAAPPALRINEIDVIPDLIEIRNAAPSLIPISIRDWFLLVSTRQGEAPVMIRPWSSAASIAPAGYAVVGNALAPPELPGSVPYASLALLGQPQLHLGSDEFTIGLYDPRGRLADLVRTTGHDDTVVHNHPRVPAFWSDFTGAAPRLPSGGDVAIGRWSANDTNSGADWKAAYVRTMGSANSGFLGEPGLGDAYDVRINESASGDGLTIIHAAGPALALHCYSFLFSLGHLEGQGVIFGLGADALQNWAGVLASPPFSGILDTRGSARTDLPPASLPPGFDLDCIFILQTPAGALAARTAILEFDT